MINKKLPASQERKTWIEGVHTFLILLGFTIVILSTVLPFLPLPVQLTLVFLPLVLLIGGILFLKYQKLILYLLLLLAPLDTFVSRVLLVSGITDKGTLIKDVLLVMLLLAVFLKGLANIKSVRPQRVDILLFLISFFFLIQALRSPYLPAGFFGLRGLVWFSIVFVFIRFFLRQTHINQLIKINLIASLLVSTYGLVQVILGQQAFETLGYTAGEVAFRTTGGLIRVISTTDSAGTLAAYTMIWICISIAMFMYYPGRLRLLFLLLAGALVINMILTTVRAAWLGVFAGVGIGWLINIRLKKWTIPFALLAIFILFSANYITNGYLLTRALSIVGLSEDRQSQESNAVHVESFFTGLDYFTEAPIFGTGLGTTGIPSIRYASFLPEGKIGLDNFYLKLLVETGIVGFLTFGMLFLGILWTSYRAYRLTTSVTHKGILLGIIMAFVGLAVMSFLHSILESPLINITFWMLSAIPFLVLTEKLRENSG